MDGLLFVSGHVEGLACPAVATDMAGLVGPAAAAEVIAVEDCELEVAIALSGVAALGHVVARTWRMSPPC